MTLVVSKSSCLETQFAIGKFLVFKKLTNLVGDTGCNRILLDIETICLEKVLNSLVEKLVVSK